MSQICKNCSFYKFQINIGIYACRHKENEEENDYAKFMFPKPDFTCPLWAQQTQQDAENNRLARRACRI